ncbi:MAG: bifunctional hydroxymethylpyrimidine kinase/phosphomethylpyrimidine kinase [Parachlamydiales bacterium]|nr:bifunctional hydroxymethylpyrimidine kinase/phosphomethylpyrimidine kinase [Candidatus Acheromyda pituitae]
MHKNRFFTVLSIAGFDGSCGAGIQADLKTFSALGCYGTTALTAIPIQNTRGVRAVFDIPASCVEEQIKAILDDIPINTVKIGMLHRQDIIESVVKILRSYPIPNIVLDPVMLAKSGDPLLMPNAIAAMRDLLFPIATVLTPNLLEASELLKRDIRSKDQMEEAALELIEMGPQAVVVKGGHLNGSCDDCLALNRFGVAIQWLYSKRINTKNTHGTGCTFSAAIASYLARGLPIIDSVRLAKHYLTRSIEAGAKMQIGQGNGPVHHFHHLWEFLHFTSI